MEAGTAIQIYELRRIFQMGGGEGGGILLLTVGDLSATERENQWDWSKYHKYHILYVDLKTLQNEILTDLKMTYAALK